MENEDKKTIEEKYRINEKKSTVGEWLKKRMSWIILIGASILFVFKEGMDFSRTEKDIITILAGMAFTYLFTLYISLSLRRMGKKSGKESSTFQNALIYLGNAKTGVKDILYLLPRFCKYKNDEALIDVKKAYLEENGLSYELYKKDYYNNKIVVETLSDKEKKALEGIVNIKITTIEPNDLLSEHSKSKLRHKDPLYLGRDETTDAKSTGGKMAVSKLLFPIITGYFAVNVALGQNMWWGAIQVGVILLMGISHYMEGEEYVVGELKNRQINKADLLIEFRNLYDNDKSIFKKEEELLVELEKPIVIEEVKEVISQEECDPFNEFFKKNNKLAIE